MYTNEVYLIENWMYIDQYHDFRTALTDSWDALFIVNWKFTKKFIVNRFD